MTAPSLSTHVDYLPGWQYLTVALDDDSPLHDEHVAVFDRVIVAALDGHPYRLYRGENWVIVAVAPPAAADAMARVEQAMATQMGAFDDPLARELELSDGAEQLHSHGHAGRRGHQRQGGSTDANGDG